MRQYLLNQDILGERRQRERHCAEVLCVHVLTAVNREYDNEQPVASAMLLA